MKRIVVLLLFFLTVFTSKAQEEVRSPFNGLALQTDSGKTGSHFIVSAHFYGGEHNKAGFPASTLLGNLGEINASDADMIVCCGDLFQDVQNDIPRYKKALFKQLQKPLFNAPGNHDVSGNLYNENFGNTYSAYTWQGDRFILLDAEQSNSSIEGEQLLFLKSELEAASNYRNIFIFSHRPIWSEEDPELEALFKYNTRASVGINFKSEILPLLETAQQKAPIYWFSGSMGDVPVSFFYHKTEGQQLHYIQTAIRDLPRDAFLHVYSDENGVRFETQSLNDVETQALETYDKAFWLEFRPKEEFNYRLIPFWMKTMITHRFFWYGVGYTVLFVLLGAWWMKRRKRRKA